MQCIKTCAQRSYLHSMPFVSYYRPRSDTCKTCDAIKIQCEAETDEHVLSRLKAELQLHHRRAERAYQQLLEDTMERRYGQKSDRTPIIALRFSIPTPRSLIVMPRSVIVMPQSLIVMLRPATRDLNSIVMPILTLQSAIITAIFDRRSSSCDLVEV